MKKTYWILSAVLLLFSIGGMAGGYLAISDPMGAYYGAPTELLKKGPFTSFIIPGLFLFIAIGLGQLVTFIFVVKKFKYHPYLLGIEGCIMVFWIIIQCFMMQQINGMHIATFIAGSFEGLTALYILIKQNSFPFDVLEKRGIKIKI